MNAERIMRKGMRMVSCRPDEALRTALSRMERSGMASLPVVDEEGLLVGMVDRDAALAKRSSFVASAMTRKVFCCRVNDTLSDVEASLRFLVQQTAQRPGVGIGLLPVWEPVPLLGTGAARCVAGA